MTITEVSKKYGLTPDTLRYYERIGLLPPVPRTKAGVRDYDEASCSWVELVKCLRGAGVQIEALIKYAALCQAEGDTNAQRIAALPWGNFRKFAWFCINLALTKRAGVGIIPYVKPCNWPLKSVLDRAGHIGGREDRCLKSM